MSTKKKDANIAKQTTAAQKKSDNADKAIDDKNLLHSLYKKIDVVTEGLERYLRNQLKERISRENSGIIMDYAHIQNKEMNLSES